MNDPTAARRGRPPLRPSVLAMAVALLLCACPQRHTRTYDSPSPGELLGVIRAQHAAIKSANMETRTTSFLGGDRVRASVLMLVSRQGKLRFEAEVSLKGTVAALATDGIQFFLLEMEAQIAKRGPACPENVAALVRIPLAPKEIAAVLLGDAPLGEKAKAVAVTWDANTGEEILHIDTPGSASKRLWVSFKKRGKRYLITGVQGVGTKEQDESRRWRVRYEDMDEGTSARPPLPATILFAEPARSFDDGVEIVIRDRRINGPVPDEVFQLSTPPGYQEFFVGCLDEDRPRMDVAPSP